MHLFSLSCGSTKSTTMRKRKGRGNDRARGRCCGPGSPDARAGQAVSDSGFACGANICSKFAAGIRRGQCRQQRTKRAGERGRLSSSSRRNWRKIYRCLKKKKRRDEIRQKDALPATAATLRRRRRQRWRQPLLNSAVHKIYDLLLVSAVGEGEQPARAKLVGGGLGGSALRLHFP